MNSVLSWSRVALRPKLIAPLAVALVASGCTSTRMSESLPRGESAYAAITPPGAQTVAEYRIKPFDVLSINTFGEPGLTFGKVPVDAVGQFSFPFIGRVEAAGLSPSEIEAVIKKRLDEKYTRNAQVTVFVAAASGLLFTVEGAVEKPGSFEYSGKASLLQSIARAGSPSDIAKVEEVAVFREVNGERYGGLFNLNDIREGRVADPEIFPGDTVVVGYSAIKAGWKNFLSLAPILNVITRF